MRSRSSSTPARRFQCRFGATAARRSRCRPGPAPRRSRRSGAGPAPGPRPARPRRARRARRRPPRRARPRLSTASIALVARAAGEIGGLHADVVDVDLQPERDHAVARDIDHQAGPPGRAAVLGAALDEQPELHQLADQAGHRALVEPGVLRDRRPRARPALDHLAQDDAQVVAPHGTLARELDRRLRGPHETDVSVSTDRSAASRRDRRGRQPPRRPREIAAAVRCVTESWWTA